MQLLVQCLSLVGLVHISRMKDDYYEYIEKYLALVGRNTHRTYRIGQPVRVKVVNVDVDQSAVDFDIVNPEDTPMSKLKPESHSNGAHGRGGRNNGGRRNNTRRNDNKNGKFGRNNNNRHSRNNNRNGRNHSNSKH